jgi:N-acetylglucosaminyldiphosphoundecaprenol N-acetyl-beta-D-mannosaminyltransferase
MRVYNTPIASPERRFILNTPVDATSYESATQQVLTWAKARRSCYVCVANVHMIMEAHDSSSFAQVIKQAAMVTPDGMPLVWALKLLGLPAASRVYGPTLMLHICEAAAQQDVSIALYGGTSESLDRFTTFIQNRFPGITIACKIAPPFRPLTEQEKAAYTSELAQSGAQILLVGIGCPKQEFWMASQANKIPAVMLGVGAAFDFHSGRVKQAPAWMQQVGLEWLFRLSQEPRRLWKRYVYHNPRFVFYFLKQWLE